MPILAKIHNLLVPRHTNNFRAKILHNSGIFAVIGLVIGLNVFVRLFGSQTLHILGFSSSVTVDEVVRETNLKRLSEGLPMLNYSEKLADAARRKADNMFTENYWAHNSPSGKSPWHWIEAAGYTYIYAGENLAKDFGNTSQMISAWMASPTHRENIVNPKYTEIGIAVVPGTIEGKETVLVVQLFGTPRSGVVATPKTAPPEAAPQVSEVKGTTVETKPNPQIVVAEIKPDRFSVARGLNLGTTALFILVLILDLVIADSKKISRRVGNNLAHLIFINFILLATTLVNAGRIM